MNSLLTLSYLTGLAATQSTTLTLPFYGYDQQSIVASVVSVTNQITTLQLACREGTDGSDCGIFPSQTLTVGPSTYNMFMSAPGGEFTGTQDCQTSAGVCSESAGGSGANFPGSSVTTYEASDVASLPVVVTAGAELLRAEGGTGSGAATSSGTVVVTRMSSASTGSGAGQTTASATGGTASETVSGTGSATESAQATSSSSAASSQMVLVNGGILGVVFGLLGGFVLSSVLVD